MNPKIGKDHLCDKVGKFSLHMEYSDNGLRLLNLSTCHNLIIGGTLFNHKNVHKGTWTSPDGLTINQIDDILIDKCHRSNLLDTKVYWSANIDSDHFLLAGRLRARISSTRNKKGTRILWYHTEEFKAENVKTVFGCRLNEIVNTVTGGELGRNMMI